MEKMDEEFPLEGKDIIKEPNDRVPAAKLYRGTCNMEGCNLEIRIKRGQEINKETYDLMKTIQHNSLVPQLNFIPDSGSGKSSHGRLALPIIETSFSYWIRKEGKKLLFDRDGNMSTLFKNMIVDICDVVEKLRKRKILIKNLGWENLYS